jgi:hypothetical protein
MMLPPLLLLLLLLAQYSAGGAAAVERGGAPCASIDDCFMGGNCTDGACVCDAWRTAANCSQMNLLPSRPDHVQVFPGEAGWSSWGAQVIYADGKYHMYASRMGNRCGLNSWWCNSEVVHAEADRPDDLFHTQATVVLPFAHNPAVIVDPAGTIVIFHIGSGETPRSDQGNCSHGISGLNTSGTKAWCSASTRNTAQVTPIPQAGQQFKTPNAVYSTSGPRGPWQVLKGDSSWGADNPAPIILDNGTALLYAKFKCNETINPQHGPCYQYGLLRADDWRGPWSFVCV